MARIRTIKPEFSHSESMGRVSRDARLLFILLWPLCDDSGRARGDSRFLARTLYPYDDGRDGAIDTSAADVEAWLAELDREGCLVRYDVDGSTYLQICNWLKHQKIDKPSASKIPEFDGHSRILARPRESSVLDLVPGPGSGPGSGPGKGTMEGDQVAPPDGDATQADLLGDSKRTTLQSRRTANPPAEVIKLEVPKTAATWAAYAAAYFERYETTPVRNAKVNSQLGQFVDRIGADEAPEVAAFFVRHPGAFYVQRCHSVDLLLGDAEKLRMEWATKRITTATQARLDERTASNPFARMAQQAQTKN